MSTITKQEIMFLRARELRKNITETETILWNFLRNRKLHGHKFKRQYVIDLYIVDFVCLEQKLIIEIDGGQHADDKARIYDEKRTDFLKTQGYQVIRFWNNEVLEETESVIEAIGDWLLPLTEMA